MIKHERNHRGHRGRINSLCSPKEFPLKDTPEKIISCAIEVHSTLGKGVLGNINHRGNLRKMLYFIRKSLCSLLFFVVSVVQKME